MDYKKFAAQIKVKTEEVKAERADLETKIKEAKDAAAAAEEKRDTAAQGDDAGAYIAAKAEITEANERAEFYQMKLDRSDKAFTLDDLRDAQNKVSEGYSEEEAAIEETMKKDLQALQKKLLPLMEKFQEHRKAGDAALREMATETDPTDTVNHGVKVSPLTLTNGRYNDSNDVEKMLKVIDRILGNTNYAGVTF